MERTLANIIIEAREQKGFSQEDLEERSGVQVAVIQAIEAGTRKKPRVNTLYKLSQILELDFVEILKVCEYITTEKNPTLGKLIWNARLVKNLSREELAEKCFLSRDGLAYIERGEVRPRYSTLKILAEELELDLNQLKKMSDNTDLGKEIKEVRENMGLTQKEVALRCGLSIETVVKVEKGEGTPKVKTLKKLALVLPLDLESIKQKYGFVF